MKQPNRSLAHRSERGLSLVEVMISLVIGLVVVGAVLVSYIGSGQTNKRQSALSEMNENAQIALTLMKNDLLLAGYSQARGTATVGTVTTFTKTYGGRAIFGCDVGFDNYATGGDAICKTGTAETPAIEIIYEADSSNTVLTAGEPTDCRGSKLTQMTVGTVNFYVAKNRYYVKSGTSGRGELHCASNASTSEPLIDNVESMQIFYGVSNGGAVNPRQVMRYVTAANVTAAKWSDVVSVRVCLVVRSADAVLSGEDVTAGLNSYLDCDSTAQTATDRHIRRAYFLTTSLRNKMTF